MEHDFRRIAEDALDLLVRQRHPFAVRQHLAVDGRDDEIARERDLGSVDQDVIDGAVEGLCGQIDVAEEGAGIDPGRFQFAGLLFSVLDLDGIGEFQERAGQLLGVAPAVGHVGLAVAGGALAVVDLASDHDQRNEQQERHQTHQEDLEREGIFDLHSVMCKFYANINGRNQISKHFA